MSEENPDFNEVYIPAREVHMYHTEFKYWLKIKTSGVILPGLSGAGGYLVNRKLYVFAGSSANGNVNTLYQLDLTTWIWSMVPVTEPLPSPRDKFAYWSYNNKLYCFGGFGIPLYDYLNGNGTFVQDDTDPASFHQVVRGWNNQLLIFDLDSNTWSNPKCQGPVPLPRAAHAACRFGHKVYMFGGRYRDQRMNDLHCLDLESLTWSGDIYGQGEVPCGRSWHSFTAVSHKCAFLYGGFTSNREPLSDAWLFDISVIQWTKLNVPSNQPRLWHTCSYSNSEVIVYGGCSNNILDYREPTIHRKDVIVLQVQPHSLVRLCLEAVYDNRERTQQEWIYLPYPLLTWLELKLKFVQVMQTLHSSRRHSQVATCSVS
ncbi:hypothetical protein CHS0354_001883 [Potamilus streckersoni]|uniref:Kelch domain-containing protein 2 n=1 Tax=Potamilus streckersoni TaxID=2493646 RepID=A0AAE0TFH6_9BIVA|nr:hypothetical protein CHS0354_001883 [Potamilus streckersoni]